MVVPVRNRAAMDGVVKFYNHFLLVPMRNAGPTQYQVTLHFGPGDGLHQTMTFRQMVDVSYDGIGSVCVYMREKVKFMMSYAHCKRAGILADSSGDREAVVENCEFRITCIRDPDAGVNLIPLEHVVRHTSHPECPFSENSAYSHKDSQ
eukprot:gnl/TRDRNA2_/TRDRNA2_155435_c0_seq2.p2 gnl/TRDRNA2_/TRDRNA2_155435_c0~~gnl/TRDRNA2_/TRDRNA2_155435_c0_seq2.p2  ORF type:complete len:149 (-),score=14.72 gnl/TRDRNA2_/TRDRNA2_155435_c0_seq2:18-464(-)